MSDRPEPVSEERVAFQGEILEIVRQDMSVGDKEVPFEWARRAPGTRLLIDNGEEILLTHEYRHEIKDKDYRLPGGKVFDSLESYNKFLQEDSENIERVAEQAAIEEAKEEAGVEPSSVNFFKSNHSGATVEWDLFYFIVEQYEEVGQNLEPGEEIDYEWYSYEEATSMCLEGEIQEDRTAAVILQYLNQKGEI
jgi:8-oxo-dGTP pyrophosphatase MutT (NUDIX family)